MIKKHFVFSYTNILKREIEKKYFSCFRKIFNLVYKLIINEIKKIGIIKDLDKKITK